MTERPRYIAQSDTLVLALFGTIVLASGMGLGRFLYTPMLPVMLEEGRFTFGQLSYIASANYAGYLFGSLFFSFSRRASTAQPMFLLFAAAAATGVLLFAMALTTDTTLVMIVRFLAGIASAAMMIFGSLTILHHTRNPLVIASLYAGVGVGIVLGNEYIVIGRHYALTAEPLWWGAALIAVLLMFALLILSPHQSTVAPQPMVNADEPPLLGWRRLALLYGLAGFGYIIIATYLPLMVTALDMPRLSLHLWSLAGLAVIPGCFFWLWAASRWGTLPCLTANLLIQGSCVLLTLFSHSPVALIFSCIGFGATFMGTTSLVMPLAKRLRVPHGINLLGLVTLTYGIGQILGPLLTSALTNTHAVAPAILCSAAALFIAAGLCFPYRRSLP
ncbi:MFS transporter [Pectobacterium brasiliense]|uniref:MFS transporter n=1 Tax=Pectobacterium brasiliense TaxID=180957 RepID=UPI001CE160BD|nr:MFS transporter [Pectobacterium brasiliense]MCA5919980.1 MFS transporter [Pectobacterium brasiliense]MCA5926631.1 MFS transporter [Pectobacterium brasiliense]MCA5935017.1 MFS transporter [Pectobacterium brasiliense]MCA5938574.1 MFS transporter [Pectobacterium brasiliense]MCA5942866.1 MFS transporter [Pectobacterium brasiliense]